MLWVLEVVGRNGEGGWFGKRGEEETVIMVAQRIAAIFLKLSESKIFRAKKFVRQRNIEAFVVQPLIPSL
jgi:hypothetical protein